MSFTELTGNPRHDQLLSLVGERGYMNIDELAGLFPCTQSASADSAYTIYYKNNFHIVIHILQIISNL